MRQLPRKGKGFIRPLAIFLLSSFGFGLELYGQGGGRFAISTNLSPSAQLLLSSYKASAYQKIYYKNAANISTSTLVYGLLKVDLNKVNESRLERLGATIKSQIDDIWSISIPIDQLQLLVKEKGIIYFDADIPISTKLDTASVASFADRKLFRRLGLAGIDGRGVVVGIVDTGFDYTNPTFLDSSGVNRIISVWDQNLSGTPPRNFSYGAELSGNSILNRQGTDSPYGTHGTHILSIAAAGEVAGGLAGIAPKSDIVLVSYKNPSSSEYASTSLSGVLDGIRYIYEKATQQHKAAVVNLSLGYHMGPHDGTSLFDQACDKLVGEGRILVGAAGNEGLRKVHLGLSFTVEDTAFRTIAGLGPSFGTSIDSWGEINHRYCIIVSLYDKSTGRDISSSPPICTSDTTTTAVRLRGSDGYYAAINALPCSSSPLNMKPRIAIYASNPTANLLKITVYSPNKKRQHVDLWNDAYGYAASFYSQGISGYKDGDSTISVSEIGGTGMRIISVGAYTTRNSYTNISGKRQSIPYYSSVGNLAPYSSKGPTIDGRIKPDITAPGNGVVAALSSYDSYYTPESYNAVKKSENGGRVYLYGLLQGTSMAAPVVTGTIALLLQQNSRLTPEDIKMLLSNGAIKDRVTHLNASGYNNSWGAGKVSALGALKQLIGDNLAQKTTDSGPMECWQIGSTFDGFIDIHCKETNELKIKVFDVQGHPVYTDLVFGNKIVNLSFLKNGLYLIKGYSQNGVGTCKLIVKR